MSDSSTVSRKVCQVDGDSLKQIAHGKSPDLPEIGLGGYLNTTIGWEQRTGSVASTRPQR